MVFAVAGTSFACKEDRECNPGNRCYFSRAQSNGVCLVGWQAGQMDNRLQKQLIPLAKRYGVGLPCQFDVDCLPNYACFKLGSAVDGLCAKVEP